MFKYLKKYQNTIIPNFNTLVKNVSFFSRMEINTQSLKLRMRNIIQNNTVNTMNTDNTLNTVDINMNELNKQNKYIKETKPRHQINEESFDLIKEKLADKFKLLKK